MLIKVTNLIVTGAILLSLETCHSVKNLNQHGFEIRQAYYQSWVVSENEKGTNVMLELTKADEGIVFDSIVFRGVRLKAFTTRKGDNVEIKSILPVGKSRIIGLENKVVNLPDQLIYHYHEKRMSCPLKITGGKPTRLF